MTIERLSMMMGVPMSTTHYWLETCSHPHVLGFMSLLEHLSPSQRQAFIEEHCRILPSLAHPRLVQHSATKSYLLRLLRKRAGITLIRGGTESSRQFLVTAFAAADLQRNAIGIDLRRPDEYVPAEGMSYIDGSRGLEHVRLCISKIWPGVITTKAPLALFNLLWSSLPDLRADILRLTRNRHVVLADEELPGPADLKRVHTEVHWVTISQGEHGFDQTRINCRRKR